MLLLIHAGIKANPSTKWGHGCVLGRNIHIQKVYFLGIGETISLA